MSASNWVWTSLIRLVTVGGMVAVSAGAGGCNKSSDASSGGKADEVQMIALGGNDVSPDGTVSAKGLKQIDEHTSDKALGINFIRTPLTDAGLDQLGKYKNLKKVQAVGSKITDAGIAKLQKAVPGVEVVH